MAKAFNVEIRAGAEIVHVASDLDGMTNDGLRRVLMESEAGTRGRVILSLLNCGYADARTLEIVLRAAARIGHRFFTVLPARGVCRRLFEIMNLTSRPFVVATIHEALTHLRAVDDAVLEISRARFSRAANLQARENVKMVHTPSPGANAT